MKKSNKLVFNLICIFVGISAFISINIAYAMSRVQEFVSRFSVILILIPSLLMVAFISLIILSYRWNVKKESRLKDIFKYIVIVFGGGWILLVGSIYFFREEVMYTNSPIRQELFNKVQHQNSFEKISITVDRDITLQGF